MRYIAILLLLAACSSAPDPAPSTPPVLTGIRDGDKNLYTSVAIGGQTWLTADLKGRHYLDGAAVPGFGSFYYKWDALDNVKGLCPKGYEIPKLTDFEILLNHFGGDPAALLAVFGEGASGYYLETGVTLISAPDYFVYWTTTEGASDAAYGFLITTDPTSSSGELLSNKEAGYCVRCIKK